MRAASPEPVSTQVRVVRTGNVHVAHSVFSWLPLTQSFIYNQLRFTPVPSIVIAGRREPSGFEWDPVYTLASRRERLLQSVSLYTGVPAVSPTFETVLRECGATLLHSHLRIPLTLDTHSARKPITCSGAGDHLSERSDACCSTSTK